MRVVHLGKEVVYIKTLQHRLNLKKGSSAIEFVIALLLLILLVAFVVDIVGVINKQAVTGQYSNYATRVISTQGGVTKETPVSFPGGSNGYMTSAELLDNATENLNKKAGIDDFDVYLEELNQNGDVASRVKLSNGSTFKIDYQKRFNVSISYRYKWNLTSQMVPGLNGTGERTVKKSGVSEYKYDYADWGE